MKTLNDSFCDQVHTAFLLNAPTAEYESFERFERDPEDISVWDARFDLKVSDSLTFVLFARETRFAVQWRIEKSTPDSFLTAMVASGSIYKSGIKPIFLAMALSGVFQSSIL